MAVLVTFIIAKYIENYTIENLKKISQNIVYEINLNKDNIENTINLLAKNIQPIVTFVDADGVLIYCSESKSNCTHALYNIPKTILDNITTQDSNYANEVNLQTPYNESSFYVAISDVNISNQQNYIITSLHKDYLVSYFNKILNTVFIISIIIISIMSVIIYFVLRKTLKPLTNISNVALQIAKGDFSVKLQMSQYKEINQLVSAINYMSISLEKLESMRKTFIANVSHELRTPMTSILGFIDGLLDGTIPKEKQRYYLDIVAVEVKRLSRLVKSMLHLSRLEAGEVSLKKENFNILDTITQILFQFEKEINNKNLNVIGLHNIKKAFVYADLDLIYQVVYNIIENAIKFSNGNGYISFEINFKDNKAFISIKNSGKGLSKSQIPLIFDRFYKTDKSRSEDKDGAGLGLYIVKTIIDQHEEHIIIKSLQNAYTEFIFSLDAIQ